MGVQQAATYTHVFFSVLCPFITMDQSHEDDHDEILRKIGDLQSACLETYKEGIKNRKAIMLAEIEQEKEFMLLDIERERAKFKEEMEKEREKVGEEERQMRAEIERERRVVLEEQAVWEREKANIYKMKGNQTDIIQLNVGGRIFTTTRGTLCTVKDTLLDSMFSGRWEDSFQRDATGAVFLDLNPDLFSLLLDHLRAVSLSPSTSNGKKITLPKFEEEGERREAWGEMCAYLGFTLVPRPSYDLEIFQRFHTHARIQVSQAGKSITLQHKGYAPAVVSGVVCVSEPGGEETRTWTLRMHFADSSRDTEAYGGLGVGVLGGVTVTDTLPKYSAVSIAGPVWAESDRKNYVCVFMNGAVFRKGKFNTGSNAKIQQNTAQMTENTEPILFTLVTHTTPPYIQITSHSEDRIELPAQWTYFRLCVVCASVGQGAEIVSVD
eukprot:GDKI01022315.1.p1 GENE.GDKI01022315.1~~GDKI01022315.1.p1  ORF type:complete len:438 (-),score=98.60 GDKI01022315.1:172-1485(-)